MTCSLAIEALMHSCPRNQWNPILAQLPILEHYYNQEFCDSNARISFRRVKEITTELLPHGPAVDLDVYGWFQPRRAQSQQNKERFSQ